MGTYGTATGVVLWFNPDTQTGAVLSLRDGEVQASMVGNGVTAANENIVLDANGIIVHDLSNASIITPLFGVGVSHDVLNNSEAFDLWTEIGTATVDSNNKTAPDGLSAIADTLNMPAVGDGITKSSTGTIFLTSGQSAVFSVWIKAAIAGTIEFRALRDGTSTVLGETVIEVETAWRRRDLIFTNTTGASIDVRIRILRDTADQLDEIYLWGAQLSYGVDRAVPYWPMNLNNTALQPGVFIRGVLGIVSSLGNAAIAIGSSWTTAPTGTHSIALGHTAGNVSSSAYGIAIGSGAGQNTTAANVISIGKSARAFHSNSLAIGNSAVSTAAAQIVLGSNAEPYTDLYGGGGVTAASPPAAFSIHATGGSGTNIAGTALKLAGGQGTGTGAGGAVVLQYAPAGGSGSSANALVDCLTINASGVAIKPGANSTTAIQLQNAAGTAVVTVDTTNGYVGIGATPTSRLHIVSPAAAVKAVYVQAAASQSANLIEVVNSAGSGLFVIDSIGRLRVGTTAAWSNKFVIDGADSISNSVTQAYAYFRNTNSGGSGHANIMLDRGSEVAVSSFGFLAAGSSNFEVGDYNNHLFLRDTRGGYVFFARWGHGIPADTVYATSTSWRFNDGGNDYDIVFEGDTDANLFVSDASTDRIGIGTNAPGYKLDVAGGVNVTSGNVYRVNGTQVVTAQQAAIADTTNTADVGVQLNKVIAALRAHGLIAT